MKSLSVLFLFVTLAGCGATPNTNADHAAQIACLNMQSLAENNVLPISYAERETIRADMERNAFNTLTSANVDNSEISVTYCDY